VRQFLLLVRGNKVWQVMTEDILDYLSWRHPLLESLRPASVSSDSPNAISIALRAYDRLVVKESRNIQANQEKIEVSSNTDEVEAGTFPCDIRVAK
jgi:hypothetical protein